MTKNTVISRVKSFITNQNKAGSTGLSLLKDCVDHYCEHADWTPLAWMVAKSDHRDGQRYRAIMGAVLTGVTLQSTSKEAKEQPTGLFFKKTDKFGKTNKYALLCDLVNDGVSFRSKEVAEALLEHEAPAFDIQKAAAAYKRFIKKLDDNSMTLDQVLKLVAINATVNADLIEKPVIAPKKAVA
jgi:hypothetical protein